MSKSKRKRIAKKHQRQRRRRQGTTRSSLVEGPTTTTEDDDDNWGSKADCLNPDDEDLFPIDYTEPEMVDGFEGGTATRDQKAAKSDDAEVPEHLWERNLFESNPKWGNNKERFRSACGLLKKAMLRFWKSLNRRSLTNWIEERHPDINKNGPTPYELVRRMPDRGRGHVRWRRCNWDKANAVGRGSVFTGETTLRHA